MLLDYFAQQLDGLKDRYKKNGTIGKIQVGLKDIRPLIGLADGQ